MHQVADRRGRVGQRCNRKGADDGPRARQAPLWATSRARTAVLRSTVITVDVRQLVLVLDDDDDRRRGRARRDGLHLDATYMQHSAGKRATARVRSCRRRPCPRRGWPSSHYCIHFCSLCANLAHGGEITKGITVYNCLQPVVMACGRAAGDPAGAWPPGGPDWAF